MATGAAAEQAAQRQQQTKQDAPEDKGPGSVAGNLTADPELRYTNNGRPVCNLRVASSERVRNPKTDKWEDGPAAFYDIQCWGNLAENVAEYMAKGYRIVAEGRWMETSWEDKEQKIQTKMYLSARDLGPSMMFRGARVIAPEGKR